VPFGTTTPLMIMSRDASRGTDIAIFFQYQCENCGAK
jgi:hypothetical protein